METNKLTDSDKYTLLIDLPFRLTRSVNMTLIATESFRLQGRDHVGIEGVWTPTSFQTNTEICQTTMRNFLVLLTLNTLSQCCTTKHQMHQNVQILMSLIFFLGLASGTTLGRVLGTPLHTSLHNPHYKTCVIASGEPGLSEDENAVQ